MKDHNNFLKTQFFSTLTKDQREIMLSSVVRKKIIKGEYLVLQGDVWPYLFFIEEGSIVAEKATPDGRAFVAATFKPGEMFWGLGFFLENAAMPANLLGFEDSEICMWAKEDLMPVIESNGKFSWELSKLVVSRIQYVSEILENMTFQPIAVRLARLLIGISGPEKQLSIGRSLTLDDMAARIGSTREMVCRLLYKFSDEGLIKITRTEFIITDSQNLEKRAQK